jgi:2-amino-4-hydroxy-6-hydroxymethyldihydropteridine diphosphokinase
MPHRAFIGIGSNLGDRAANYREAIARIAAISERRTRDPNRPPPVRVVRQSSIYETEPVDDEHLLKFPFLNGVIEVESELTPEQLMRQLLAIERSMGRKRVKGRKPTRGRYRPRIIDLDLLFFDKEVINTRALQVPHPRLHERRFVLAPMAELAPTLMHPKLNASISELLAALKSPHRVTLARADLLRPPQPRREAALR